MARKLKAGIVGCGRIASLFAADKKRKGIVTHAQAYLRHSATLLAAACDRDPLRLKDFSAQWKVPHLYTDSLEMFRRESLDIVSICTPPAAHFSVTREAILSGVKTILCEKPLATSLKEADELIRLAQKHRVRLAVNHSRRWDLFEQNIRRFIQSGKLGKIQSADCYYTAGISNTGSHLIDLFRMLTGHEILKVQAFRNALCDAPDPTPDACWTVSGGYRCFLHGLNVQNFLMFEIHLYGTQGCVKIKESGFSAELWKSIPHHRFSGYRELVQVPHRFGNGYQNVLKNAIDNLIAAAQGKAPILSTAQDGQAALEVLAACRESLKKGGKCITLPLKNRALTV